MALAIDTAAISYRPYPAGATEAAVEYRIVEEGTGLARSGIVVVPLSASLRAQLAAIVEDALRAAGKL